jgi:hypothetical protein
MKDSPDFRTRLLAATLHGEWAEGSVAVFAQQAAAATRRRRRQRHFLLGLGSAAGLAAALLLGFARPALRIPAARPANLSLHNYEIISDDQLLADVRDRGLLAIREPGGSRRIIVLTASTVAR